MLAGLDQGRGSLAGAGIQSPIMGEQPGQPGTARTRRGFAVEQGRKQAQGIDEFAHRRRATGRLAPGVSSNLSQVTQRLARPARVIPSTGAAPRFAVRQRIREIAIALDRRLIRGKRRAGIGQNRAQQIAQQQGQRFGEESLALLGIRTRQLVPRREVPLFVWRSATLT